MTYLFNSLKEHRSRGRPNWVIVPTVALELLAHLLDLPVSGLLATTYQLELANLYNTPYPHATFLNRSFPFRLCPDCIAERRLIRRALILPHITSCPYHHVVLVGVCRCGSPLQLFQRQSLPFTCLKCHLDWGELPRLTSKPERIALEQKLMSYYTFFFENARQIVIAKAQQLVRDGMKKGKIDHARCFDGNYRYVECYDAKRISLSFLVELLVSLDLSTHDIEAYEGPLPWWSVRIQKPYGPSSSR
jgi:hypothetical protein